MIISSLFSTIITTIHVLFSVFLIITAYSSYFSIDRFPILSILGLGFPIALFCYILFTLGLKIFRLKKFSYTIIVLLIISPQIYKYIPFNFPQNIPENSLKVVSYNVMGFAGAKKDKNGENKILEYLKNSDADIICIQEYAEGYGKKKNKKRDIVDKLSAYPYYKIHPVGSKNSINQLAIFSKYPIKKAEPIKYNSSYNGSVAYELNINGDRVLVVNNHFESNKITQKDKVVYEKILKLDDEKDKLIKGSKKLMQKLIEASLIRKDQAEIVNKYIAEKEIETIILCGDFNDSPLSYTNRLLGKELRNAFVESGTGLGISYNQNKFYFRIDNILISKNLKTYHTVVDNSISESDHYPIWCYVGKR